VARVRKTLHTDDVLIKEPGAKSVAAGNA